MTNADVGDVGTALMRLKASQVGGVEGASVPDKGAVGLIKRRLYDVSVTGYGSAIFEAPTRGKALADAWRCDAFGSISFRAFMSMARATIRRDPPPTDGYSYVRERYGMDPKVGGRARINKGEGKSYQGREGTILWAGMARYNHIRIHLDGDKEPLNFHPSNVILLPSRTGATAPLKESTPAASTSAPSDTSRLSGATTPLNNETSVQGVKT